MSHILPLIPIHGPSIWISSACLTGKYYPFSMKAGQICGFNRPLTLSLKKTDVIAGKSTFFSPPDLKKSLKYIIPHSGHQQRTGQKTNHSEAAEKARGKLRYW